jgi:hypothetical protein
MDSFPCAVRKLTLSPPPRISDHAFTHAARMQTHAWTRAQLPPLTAAALHHHPAPRYLPDRAALAGGAWAQRLLAHYLHPNPTHSELALHASRADWR